MSHWEHDSSDSITLVPMSGTGAFAPLSGSLPSGGVAGNMPMLDLTSDGPLPPLGSPAVAPASIVPPVAEDEEKLVSADGSFWIEGEVLMCACPDCSAPMSIRIWLMVADCWQCGTSIELTEEQEREAKRLLDRKKAAQEKETQRAPNNQANARSYKTKRSPPNHRSDTQTRAKICVCLDISTGRSTAYSIFVVACQKETSCPARPTDCRRTRQNPQDGKAWEFSSLAPRDASGCSRLVY